jgi:uncharacterized protein YneR
MSACGSSGGTGDARVGATPTVTAVNNANAIESWINSIISQLETNADIKDLKKEQIEKGKRVTYGLVGYDDKEVFEYTKPTTNRIITNSYFFEGVNEKSYEKNEIRMENNGSIIVLWSLEKHNDSRVAKTNGVSSFNSFENFKNFVETKDKLTSADFNNLMNKFLNNGFSGGAMNKTSEEFSYTRNKDNLNIYIESDGDIYVKVNNNSSVKMFERSLGDFEQLTVDKVLNIFYDVLNKENITEDDLNSLGFI